MTPPEMRLTTVSGEDPRGTLMRQRQRIGPPMFYEPTEDSTAAFGGISMSNSDGFCRPPGNNPQMTQITQIFLQSWTTAGRVHRICAPSFFRRPAVGYGGTTGTIDIEICVICVICG
jgi:hypothetical protein